MSRPDELSETTIAPWILLARVYRVFVQKPTRAIAINYSTFWRKSFKMTSVEAVFSHFETSQVFFDLTGSEL